MKKTLLLTAGALLCVTAHPQSASAQTPTTCAELRSNIEQLPQNPSSQNMRELHDQALSLPDCDQQLMGYLLRRIAVAMAREADNGSLTVAQRKKKLEESLQYHRLWQVLKELGDIAYERRDYVEATMRYQQALEAIDDPETTADRHVPDSEIIFQIYRLAAMTRLVAQRYVAAPVNRAGEPTGLGAGNVRGFTFDRVAVPVTYVFGETRFDAEGQLAAQDLLVHLRSQGSPNITLIGHTDPVGSRPFNQGLSEARAQTLAQFLKSNGYEGQIRTMGRGEDEPYEVPDPTRFTQDELHKLYRRVELQK